LKVRTENCVEEARMNRVGLLFLCFAFAVVHAHAADTKVLYVQVISGTDKDKPAGSNYREVGPKLRAKLSPVFRWKHYWETDRKRVQVDLAKVTRVPLSQQRTVEIERLKSGELEVRLYRRSGLVTKNRQAAKSRMVILGGEEPGRDSFFIVVRSDEPKSGE
jgi:hypothetical protein